MVFRCVFYGNCVQIHGILIIYIYARPMKVNVNTCTGGGSWYENDIHRNFQNQGSSKGYYIFISCLKVWDLWQLCTNAGYFNSRLSWMSWKLPGEQNNIASILSNDMHNIS